METTNRRKWGFVLVLSGVALASIAAAMFIGRKNGRD